MAAAAASLAFQPTDQFASFFASMSTSVQEQVGGGVLLSLLLLCVYACAHLGRGAIQSVARLMMHTVLLALVVVSLFSAGLVLISTMFVAVPLFRYSPKAWYAVANHLWMHMWALCILYCETFGGLRVVYQGDLPLASETTLVLSNHLSELDWIVVLGLAARRQALAGVRFLAKASLAKLPLLGWGLWLHDTVFIRSRPPGRGDVEQAVDRSLAVNHDLEDTTRTVRRLTEHHGGCMPGYAWIGLFPEGTRLTPEQHERTLAYAEAQGLPAYAYLLQPRSKGLDALLRGGRPGLTHALDLTIAYEGFSAQAGRNARQYAHARARPPTLFV